MKSMKKCKVTQPKLSVTGLKRKRRNRRDSSAGRFITSSAGAVTSLILMVTLCGVINLFAVTTNTSATTSSLTVSVADSINLDILPTGSTGTFATSSTSTNNVSVKTTNGTGYVLGIKAGTNNSNTLSTTGGATIPSITTSISESTFSTSSDYNDKWGYRPSKLNSADNTNYLQAPTSSSTVTTLDQTTVANASTANNYNVAVGARVTNATKSGAYSNTFVFTVVANPTKYSITYNQNATDTVTNMPSNVTNATTTGETVNIANTVPARDGYNFKGWCTAQVADGASCTGTTYNPDGGGTDLTWTLDQTAATNSLNVYAIWESDIVSFNDVYEEYTVGANNRIDGYYTMQSFPGCWDITVGQEAQLIDSRDHKIYWVAKLTDDNCWMTQNLALDIGFNYNSDDGSYSWEDTDIPDEWEPDWESLMGGDNGEWYEDIDFEEEYNESNYSIRPKYHSHQWECWNGLFGNNYYIVNGSTGCDNLSQGTHYSFGNYYNWAAAIAVNDTNGYASAGANADRSICPAGWTLPDYGNNSLLDTYTHLRSELGLTSGINGNIHNSPAYFVYGGEWGDSSDDVGNVGYYWTKVASNYDSAYIFYFDRQGNIGDYGWYSLESGYQIRCVARY